jgi:aspartate/methionine/tyrosine aminotransferase
MFLFTNPVNPTGVVYNKEEVEKLAAILKKH